MVEGYPHRYTGKRWTLYFGNYADVEETAINSVQKMIQAYLPYVLEIELAPADWTAKPGNKLIMGTPDQIQAISALLAQKHWQLADHPQAYLLACFASPWVDGDRILLLTAPCPAGLLYAAQELGKQLAVNTPAIRLTSSLGKPSLQAALDALPELYVNEAPKIDARGIWSWGYVIRDYRRYIDHMLRLRLNTLIIWNDIPPVNSPQVIAYAHSHGISLIYGFHWGWGLSHLDITSPEDRLTIKNLVLQEYQQHYQTLTLDGIYFQTLTEHNSLAQNGISTAQAACQLVNEISSALFGLQPDLKIYFGLHATSIRENYTDLQPLDPRVTIIWEDAGDIPYTYDLSFPSTNSPEETLAYSKKLVTFRTGSPFAIVPKGWTCLRWEDEFEHHGSFILGEQSSSIIHQKLEERELQWNRVNALWFQHFPVAAKFYREILQLRPSSMLVTGLVEDGGLDETIQPAVALFAETLWNPSRPDAEILQAALNPFYKQE